MNTAKHTYESFLSGKLIFNADKSLTVENNRVNKTFNFDEMQELSKTYKGINRIHKPMALLFWTDCKNGEFSNWER